MGSGLFAPSFRFDFRAIALERCLSRQYHKLGLSIGLRWFVHKVAQVADAPSYLQLKDDYRTSFHASPAAGAW